MKNARVIIVSPWRGDEGRNKKYVIACLRDSLKRGESPFAGHFFYTHFLDDSQPEDRASGMSAGRDWMLKADIVAIYTDLGMSEGMIEDKAFAFAHKIKTEERNLAKSLLISLGII